MEITNFDGRRDVDLHQISYQNLGIDESMACPQCSTPLGVIEFETKPRLQIEYCGACHGMFFNPGEIESLLDTRTQPGELISQATGDPTRERQAVYQKCPICSELMNHINFGGRSGILLDRCSAHGIWLDGIKFQSLSKWWQAGGRMIHQQQGSDQEESRMPTRSGPITSPANPEREIWSLPDTMLDPSIVIDVILSAGSMLFED